MTKNDQIKLLSESKNRNSFESEKIIISTIKEKHFIIVNDIIYCKSEGSYTKIVTKNATIVASKNLKFYQEKLFNSGFIRTHKSFLINPKSIKNVKSGVVSLTGNVEIPVSFRKKIEVKNLLLKR